MGKGGQTIGGSYPVDVSKKWNGGKGKAVVERESLEVAGETDGAKKKRRISSKEQVFCDKALAAISKGANVNAYNAGVCICDLHVCVCVLLCRRPRLRQTWSVVEKRCRLTFFDDASDAGLVQTR